jgi:hypothetical protein
VAYNGCGPREIETRRLALEPPEKDQRDAELRALAKRIGGLMASKRDDDERHSLDYLLGALFALRQANALDFQDRATACPVPYWPGVISYAQATGDDPGSAPDRSWLAGFFFNSALGRIAACLDRLATIAWTCSAKGDRPALVDALEGLGWGIASPRTARRFLTLPDGTRSPAVEVYAEVNRLKHRPEGLADGRAVPLLDAVRALREVVDFVEQELPSAAAGG